MPAQDLGSIDDNAAWYRQLMAMMGASGQPTQLPGAVTPAPVGTAQPNAGSWNWPIGSAQAGEQPNPNDVLRAALAARARGQQQTQPPDINAMLPVGRGPSPTPPGGRGAGLNAPNYTNPMLAAGVGPGAGLNAGTGGAPPASPYATAMPWRGPIADRPTAAAAGGSPFTQIYRPNADPGVDLAGGRRRTGGGPLMMSALDLSRLFGRST